MRVFLRGFLSVALALLPIMAGMAEEGQANAPPDPLLLLKQAKDFYGETRDYVCRFRRQERLGGKLRKTETIHLKFAKPFRVYMKWLEDPGKGQELLYVPGKYDNKLKVHVGGLLNLIIPSLTLDPDSPQVRKNARHPITNAGLGNMIESLIRQFELAMYQGDLEILFHGEESIDGTDCFKFERILPKDKGYYCHRLVLHLNQATGMPVRAVVFDWNNTLIESYTYTRVQWNVGLTDTDFDAGNGEYDFGLF